MSDRGELIVPGKDTAPDRRDRRIAELEAELEQARAENVTLKARIVELERRLVELERAANEPYRRRIFWSGCNERRAGRYRRWFLRRRSTPQE